jgi:hypothetical protein
MKEAFSRRGKPNARQVSQARAARWSSWQTSKPVAVEEFRVGGYGLLLARASARDARTSWRKGRAVVRAQFSS